MISKGDEAGMYKSNENETFDGYNIPVALAAKIMGKDQQYIRQGLVQGILPIGTAFKREGSKHYDYYISQGKARGRPCSFPCWTPPRAYFLK